MDKPKTHVNYSYGPYIALLIILLWSACLIYGLSLAINWASPMPYLLILFQTHLYTGIFITAHDGIHGAISKNKRINLFLAHFCSLLVAYNWFPAFKKKHILHHVHVATNNDPDYYQGPFLIWYLHFLKNYISWYQIVLMALTYNVLMLFFHELNVVLFWMIPSILSTLQLFYFGTYLPHRGEHAPDNRHKSRSLKRNHLWAFISCYFFGYHYEHHDAPFIPWWMLYKRKAL